MPATTPLGLPYPAPSDAGDVPYWLQQAMEAVQAAIQLRPRGVLAYAQVTVSQGVASGSANYTGLSVTFTADPARRYRFVGNALLLKTGAQGTANVQLLNASGTVWNDCNYSLAAGEYAQFQPVRIVAGLSGSQTVRLAVSHGAGGSDMIASSTRLSSVVVEDIGPA